MSMKFVRQRYGVPAKRGGRIRYRPRLDRPSIEGTILSADSRIRVRLDTPDGRRVILHPTWRVEYLDSTTAGAAP